LRRLQAAVNTQRVYPRPAGQTPAQHCRGLRLQKSPATCAVAAGEWLEDGRRRLLLQVTGLADWRRDAVARGVMERVAAGEDLDPHGPPGRRGGRLPH
jgi:hypothetical protein